jgi:hypothetical protein
MQQSVMPAMYLHPVLLLVAKIVLAQHLARKIPDSPQTSEMFNRLTGDWHT